MPVNELKVKAVLEFLKKFNDQYVVQVYGEEFDGVPGMYVRTSGGKLKGHLKMTGEEKE